MTEYDFVQIARLFQIDDNVICNRLTSLENTYQIFHRYDSFDFFELLQAKMQQDILNDIEQRVLRMCDYLLKYDKEKERRQ